MSVMKYRNVACLAKVEGTYGVDSTPGGVNDAVLATTLEITPMDGDTVAREIITGKPGNNSSLLVGTHISMTIKIELQGSGAAGTPPVYNDLLRCAALSETITATVKTEYTPVNSGESSATIYFYTDGQLHIATGCRGSVKYGFDIKGIPYAEFTLKGLYGGKTSAANPATLGFGGYVAPFAATKQYTNITLDGYVCNAKSFELDHANAFNYFELTNEQSIQVTDRAPAGQFVIEEPLLTNKDFLAIAQAQTQISMLVTHGVGAGKILQWVSGAIQLGRITYSNEQNVRMLTIPYTVIDDYIFRVR